MMPNHEDIPVPTNSKFYKSYTFGDAEGLKAEDYEVSHQGYNNAFVLDDPNCLVPVDAMRTLEKEGKIGSLLDTYYTTAGVMTPMEVGKKFGEGIARDLKDHNVDAVILTST